MKLAILTNSSVLNGLTGDNGEEYCVFMKGKDSPTGDVWAWFFSVEDAEKWAEENHVFIMHKCIRKESH